MSDARRGEPRASLVPCPQCGALVADVDGPVHAYVPSAPGCWAAFGELRADELLRSPDPLSTTWPSTRTWPSIPATEPIGVTASPCSSIS